MQTSDPIQRRAKTKQDEVWLRGWRKLGRRPLSVAVSFGVAGGILLILQAWCLARIIDAVVIAGQGLTQIWPWMMALLVLYGLRAICLGSFDLAAFEAAARVKQMLRIRLYDHISALGPAWVSGARSGEVANAMVEGVEEVEKYYASYLPQRSLTVFIPLAILVVVFPSDWISGITLLVTAPLIPVFMILIGKGAESLNQRQWRRMARMSAHFFDAIEGLTTLKLFNASRREAEVVAQISDAYRQSTMAVLRVAFLSSLVLEFFATLSVALIAVFIGFRLFYGEMSFLPGLFALLLAPEFFRPLRDMGAQYHARMEAIGAAEGLIRILATPLPEQAAEGRDLPPRGALEIRIEDVSFHHPADLPLDDEGEAIGTVADRGGLGVEEISLTLSRGGCVALVGPSGAGKTTLTQLLLRFIAPQQGRILVNGLDLAALPEEVWMARIGWMPQRPTLFYGTILDNIRLGHPEAGLDEVRAAASAAQAAGFIERLPQGYETPVGDAGQGLSGGEIQRIALARMFLKPCDLLVLDEPTAALDRDTARAVLNSIAAATADHAVLLVTHDLEAARMADRILVMEQGRIVEAGTHASLIKAGGAYARMASLGREVLQ